MTIHLYENVYSLFGNIEWFSRCGDGPAVIPNIAAEVCVELDQAIASASGSRWQEIRTEAQGDLTACLAKKHRDAYSHWNRLAKESRVRIEQDHAERITVALDRIGAISLHNSVLLDLNRIAIHAAFSSRFRDLPDFYRKLLAVYESGRLPCGWSGDISSWPQGFFLVY